MSVSPSVLDDCGCCDEPTVATPVITNPAGLSAIAYRIGTQPQFKARMTTAIGTLPALSGLTSRDASDPSIALVDAWATVLDVLTFYQERIANEGFLRTAAETQSVYSLAAEIGYAPNPGVAADVYLAFQLESSPAALRLVTVPTGTKVQSLPDPKTNSKPQIFETVADFDAHVEWNVLYPRPSVPQRLGVGENSAVLAGTATLLKAGDGLLFVGFQRANNRRSQHWDFRVLETVTVDPATNTTVVTWGTALGHQNPTLKVHPEHSDLHVYAMRTRAGVFGFNAPDWRLMSKDTRVHWGVVDPTDPDPTDLVPQWPHFRIFSPFVKDPKNPTAPPPSIIDLDAVYSEAAQKSYVLLTLESYAQLFKIAEATQAARADFGLSGKTTRITLDGPNLKNFARHVRDTVVHLQGPEVALADLPLATPVHGRSIALDRVVGTLTAGQTIIVSGKRARAVVAGQAHHLTVLPDAPNQQSFLIRAGESVQMTADYTKTKRTGAYVWSVRNASGLEGKVEGQSWMLKWVPALDTDETISEVVMVTKVDLDDATHTRLAIAGASTVGGLLGCYDRASVRINANVVRGTHGETRQEVLGSGDASQTFQTFALRQSPLTYTSSSDPGGGTTTLTITVDGVRWSEVPTLYGRGPHEQVYVVRIAADGSVAVEFGDGVNGARLPTGVENVKATYRVGTGRPGNVGPDRIKLLMTRPLGVQSVDNPVASGIGADAESMDSARANAPQQVVTFSRVVSLTDFEDFARGFAGIAKAQADWLWDGDSRIVFVTVAGTDGASVDDAGLKHQQLVASIASYGDAHQQFVVATYEPVSFGLAAQVFIEPGHDQTTVVQAATNAVTDAFSFGNRSLGQPVFESDVIAAIQGAQGVLAVDLTALYVTTPPPTGATGVPSGRPINYMRTLPRKQPLKAKGTLPVALPSRRARLENGVKLAAQLVTIDPNQVLVTAT